MEPELLKQEMELALRTAGYRMTSQREAIVDYLASTFEHPGAARVFQEVKKKQPGLSLATVYNTLHVLTVNGLIKMLTLKEENRYEANLSFHINLLCASCGKIQDLEVEPRMTPEEVRERSGFEVMSYRMEYHGLCSECKAMGKQKSDEPKQDHGEL